MSHNLLNPGLISAYNSLTDKHLAGYFSNTRIRRHLQRAGLITRSGRIVPDKEYRQKLIQRAHQRHVRECLAQAIFHKVLEMERLHQIEIKRKLEEFARRERVHKIKVERSKRYEEDIPRIMSPRPPTGVRGVRKQHSGAEAEQSESSESPGSSRPNTAPGKMQRPVRLKPLHGTSTAASHRHSSPYRRHNTQRPFNRTVDKDTDRGFNSMEVRNGVSPYCLPVINNFVTPVPPSTKRRECPVKLSTSSTHRGRRLRPRTSSCAADATKDGPVMRSSVLQSRVCVNMVYLGKAVHLSHDLLDMRDDVRVFQQHCGGENLCVYKGRLREGESFQFISRRHRGFPFSLTFFLNGLQVERLSSCCEFKHRKSSRIGGRHGHFAFSGVEAASPCYKCIIAMGLDKKPVPPPRRVKEDGFKLGIVPRLKVTAGADAEAQKLDSENENTAAEMTETQDEPHEDRKAKDDYEEDFEADDEGPVEEEEDKEKESTSPKEEKGNESDASDSETDDDRKSRSGSSFSGSESDAEEVAEARAAEEGEHDKPEDEEEQVPEESPQVEAAQAPEFEAKDCIVLDSTGQSTEIEICDTSGPSAAEGERRTEEPERANSVQEKLAEATKESHCSSEPELNNTSTETTQPGSSKSTDKEIKETETSAKKAKVIEEAKIDVRMAQEADKPEDDATKEPEDAAKVENDGTDQAASEVGKDLGEKDSSEETAGGAKSSPVLEEPNGTDREEGEQEEQTLQREESLGVDSKPDETAEAESTQAMTGAQTMEMKAEARDTQKAINAQVSTAADTPDNNEQQGEEEKAESEKAEPEKAESEKAEPEKAEPEKAAPEIAEPENDAKDESKESCQVEVEMGGIEKERVESDLVDKDKTDEEGGAEKVVEGHKRSINEASAEEMGTDLNRNEQGKDEGDHLEEKHPHDENKAEEEDVTDSNTDEKVDVAQKHPGDNPNKELEHGESDDVQNGDTSNIDNGETQQTDSGVTDEPYQTLASQHLEPAIQKVEDQETCAESLKLEEKVEFDKREREIVSEEDPKHNKMASENLDSNIQKEEAQETSAESLKVAEKEVAEEDHKDLLNKSPASDDPDKKLVVENLNSAVQNEEEQVTIAEGLKLQENVESDKRVEDEDHKEILKNPSASDEVEKDHKNGVDYSDVTEVDVENGEVSVFAETKPPDGDMQKQATEQIVKHRDDEVEKLKKEENENIGSDSNAVTSIDQNSTEISEDLDATEKNNVEETRVGSGENGDTEEASKASEEGASILLKPQVQLSEPKEQKGTPEGLTTANSADLVTNWVTMHQTSKYFETFVEPLEEMSDMNSQTSNKELTEVAQSKSPVEVVGEDKKGVESAGEESKEQETENETKDGTSERGSNQSQDRHKASTKALAQVEESTVFPAPNVETGGNMEPTVIEGSLKSAQLNNNLTRTSITSSHRTITSVFQTVSGSLNEEKVSGQDITVVPKTEELSSSLKVREDAQQNSENKEVTTDFMTSTLNSGTQEGSNENQSSIGEDKEVLKESDHIVSQEHLSSFSVDSSFALVAASNAVNGL
ncbi:unnamed protein product [Knipowitschia caucasica]|uniref:DUF4590 domain-containing protein n=1 Tax=Knipowitschia caucasica TaxID=637954 RepID=A0AAV2KYQ9_KNICA